MHQNGYMRLTISLEPDIDPVVRALAKERDSSLSAAVNELVRRGLAAQPVSAMAVKDGLPVVHGRRPFTSEDVYRLEAEGS